MQTLKTIFLTFSALALLLGVAYSDTVVSTTEGRDIITTETLTLTADGSGNISGKISGAYLYQVEASSTGDDAFTFVIKSELGNTLFSGTWSSATSDEAPKLPSEFYAIPKGAICTYTLSDFAGTSLTIQVSTIKK